MQEFDENSSELDEILAQMKQENFTKCWHSELLDRFFSELEKGDTSAKQIAEKFNATKPSAAEIAQLLQNDDFISELQHFYIYGCGLDYEIKP